MAALKAEATETKQSAKETHDAVQALVKALLEPQPGHRASLLDRIAAVTIMAERGNWALHLLIWVLGAGVTVAAAWASLRIFDDLG